MWENLLALVAQVVAALSAAAPATPDDLPAGPPPAVAYVDRGTYVDPHGRRTPLPDERGISGVVPYDGGFLVSDTAWFERSNGLALVRDGRPVRGWFPDRLCSSGTPAASDDGAYVAWVATLCPESGWSGTGQVHRARVDGTGEVTEPLGSQSSVVGFLGSRVVYVESNPWRVLVTDFATPPIRIPGIDFVVDVDERRGRLIGVRGDHARVVVDLAGRVVWRSQHGSLGAFSPRGGHVVAWRRHELTVLDADDGSVVATLRNPSRWATSMAWEDERHLLVVASRHGRSAVVRLGLDGSAERATPVAAERPGDPPYLLLD